MFLGLNKIKIASVYLQIKLKASGKEVISTMAGMKYEAEGDEDVRQDAER